MKYEEWIEYERARLDDQNRQDTGGTQRAGEERKRANRDSDQSPLSKYRGPILPNPRSKTTREQLETSG